MSGEDDYGGMTVNERLFVAGLIEAFDDAVARRDRAAMVRLLETAEVSTPEATADAVLANPTFYGYPP